MDKETQSIIREGDDRTLFLKSEEWRKVKNGLLQKLSNIDSVKSLKGKTADEKIREIEVRSLVIDIIIDWIDEVEGLSSQSKGNKELLSEVQKEDYIINY